MLPTAWVFLDKMPLSPNGKVDRAALPSPSAQRPELAQAYTPPQTGLEKHLADIWCELLHLDRVGTHDRFFELGGTSVQAIEFISILVRELDADIPIVKFFEEPTIAGFAAFLEKECARRIAGTQRRRRSFPCSSPTRPAIMAQRAGRPWQCEPSFQEAQTGTGIVMAPQIAQG